MRKCIFTVMTVFVVKGDSAYPQLRVNDHIVTGRLVFVFWRSSTLSFHPRPALGIISFLVHSSNIVKWHNAVEEDVCFGWQKFERILS